jgi:uncharacterized membrane protein
VKTLLSTLVCIMACLNLARAQEYFTITRYDVHVKVNKNASLDVEESIYVRFTEPRHGLYRLIPYKYPLQPIAAGTEKADRQMESGGYAHTIIENISVDNWNYEVNSEGDYKVVKIGSADKYVEGNQQYVIRYRMLNAINFFNDHSEFYFNIIGNQWKTAIDSVNFTVSLYESPGSLPEHFVATGLTGSTENNTVSGWTDPQTFKGITTRQLAPGEGLTVGIRLPKDFLVQEDYTYRGIYWLILPLIVFAFAFWAWRRWGKDHPVTVTTQYYPPPNLSPSVCGYVIDDSLHRRDLTALIPYWGAGGYLKVKETENSALFGLIRDKEYQFIKLKDLPRKAMNFERTLFDGIFESGDSVKLSDLKNKLYKAMATAQKELESEINRNDYYVKGSRLLVSLFIVAALIMGIAGFIIMQNGFYVIPWNGIAFFASAAILLMFGLFMTKKTEKGTLLYQQLLGFREFIRSVETDRLKEFLEQDPHYFDKILPYAIVFNVADTWKDRLKGLEVPPPSWYTGNYHTYNTAGFMNSLNDSLNTMSSTFYSSPGSSGSSGGSFSGGGSSGGGFGGGGGGSW